MKALVRQALFFIALNALRISRARYSRQALRETRHLLIRVKRKQL